MTTEELTARVEKLESQAAQLKTLAAANGVTEARINEIVAERIAQNIPVIHAAVKDAFNQHTATA